MQEIQGNAKTIRQLLSGAKYTIDYYQRDYEWTTKQVQELLDDLTLKFLEDYAEGHSRGEVDGYGHYFLGSIIISDKQGQKFIVDGQQRLTTLTLLLIFLHNTLAEEEERNDLTELVFSTRFGRKSFNIDVEERVECMEALFNQQTFDETDAPDSVQNIVGRYQDIEDLFPDELKASALPYSKDWLIEHVHLVEITAYADEDAYTIFETMNDRGLSLSPSDMLKGYLLANVKDQDRRNAVATSWRQQMSALQERGKEECADAVKAWLRSQHARNIRERRKGAKAEDFDRIGTEFHRWVRENKELLQLDGSEDFERFVQRDFRFFARQYEHLLEASRELTPGLEHVYYNAEANFTLQYPVLLAPLTPEDTAEEIARKLRITAIYLDILVARRMWNWRDIGYNTMQYAMFLLMRDIRGKPADVLTDMLLQRLENDEHSFAGNDRYRLHGANKRHIHRILARITEFIETSAGMPSRFVEYTTKSGRNGYEVEHIWANHQERHLDEFDHPADFDEYRNRIGGLLLLPKNFNASYGDMPYAEKRDHYNGQNLLARSLHEACYDHNPGFLRFIGEQDLAFQAHETFKKADLDERQALYRSLAERIWDPTQIARAVGLRGTSGHPRGTTEKIENLQGLRGCHRQYGSAVNAEALHTQERP